MVVTPRDYVHSICNLDWNQRQPEYLICLERQKNNMNEELTELQFQILDSIYFMESLVNIVEEAEMPRAIVIDEIRIMIDKGWVQVMGYDEEAGDFIRTGIFDNDNLDEYKFLVTKDGLMKHNGNG